MSGLLLLLALGAPLFAAAWVSRPPAAIEARARGAIAMMVALGASVLALAWDGIGLPDPLGATALVTIAPPSGWPAVLPAFVSAIGLTAIAMSPVEIARPGTFGRILIVNAASIALVLTRDPIGLAILWTATAMVPWRELRARVETRPAARAFAAYHAPSVALVSAGAILATLGMERAAVLPIAAGVAIRAAVVPLHSWFPSFAQRAPMGMVIAFVAPQLGVYAHLVWLSGRLPPPLESAVAALGVVTVVFAAAMGVAAPRARRAIAYLLLSETALVALGLETHSDLARTGAIAAWLVSGLATAGLAMTLAALEARRGRMSIDQPNGSFRRIPLLATAFLVLGLATVGLPGTLGFIAEDLLVQGSVETVPLFGVALIVGTALNSVTVVRTFFALFTGSRQHAGERDLTGRERAALTMLLGALMITGLWPRAIVPWLDHGDGAPVAEETTR